jgi:hypothetical protein
MGRDKTMDINELARTMGALGTRCVEEYTRGVQRCAKLLSDAAVRGSGDANPLEQAVELQKRYAEFVLTESPRIVGRLAEAGISYYAALASTGVEVMNSYVEQVLKPDSAAPQDAGEAARAPRSPLLFHGERGHRATNAFLVTNNRDEAIDVTFDVGEVESADGEVRFKPKAEFTPGRCKLAPRAQQVVQCSLQLSKDFAAGQVHGGAIQVAGYPEMAMPISVEVEEPTPAAAAARRTAPRGKAAAKRRAPRKRTTPPSRA